MNLPEIKKPKFAENLDASDALKLAGAILGGIGVFIITKIGESVIADQPLTEVKPVEINDVADEPIEKSAEEEK